MVVGLSAAALQGAPVVTQDRDLWFEDLSDPKLAPALAKVGAGYVPHFGWNPPMLAGQGSEVFDVVIRMDGLEWFSAEWKRALEVRLASCASKCRPWNVFSPASRRRIVQRTSESFRFCGTAFGRFKRNSGDAGKNDRLLSSAAVGSEETFFRREASLFESSV
jgi:hypothetical protein